jgi:transcriptional regulator with XRE-family HTH domain
MARRAVPVDPSIGDRIRTRREMRGWSMRHAADRAGVAHTTWSRIERGELRTDRYMIADLAAALECAITDLTGQPYVPADRDLETAHAQVERVWRALMAHPLTEPADTAAPPVDQLAAETELVRNLYDRCDYAGALTRLGSLIPALHAAARNEGARRALDLMVPVYGAAMGSLLNLGYPAHAWLAAERCAEAAGHLEDPVALAVAACNSGRVQAAGGAYGPARTVVDRAAGELEHHLDAPAAVEVLGFTHLARAHHTLGLKDPAAAAGHLAEARTIADRTGETTSWDLAFGPVNAALWTMTAQLDSGEPGRAIQTGRGIAVGGLPPTRQVAFYIDMARGLSADGHDDEAVAMLLAAERVAPQYTRSSTAAKVVARSLLPQARRPAGSRLRGLCERMGVTA